VDALEAAQAPLPMVFGHHDLLPGNFIDDGKRLWLIDWEYAGFGTAMFDLANLATNGRSPRTTMFGCLKHISGHPCARRSGARSTR
jgi:aminoglycoside phosphotransferase (APT) family kinase protein